MTFQRKVPFSVVQQFPDTFATANTSETVELVCSILTVADRLMTAVAHLLVADRSRGDSRRTDGCKAFS